MLLLPLMVYGNSEEFDMNLGQFVIMFRAIFLEGFFRPEQTIKELLDLLLEHYRELGGEIRYRSRVREFIPSNRGFKGVILENGEAVSADAILSTAGIPGTARLAGWPLDAAEFSGRMSFMESIYLVPLKTKKMLKSDRTIIFYNNLPEFSYCRPDKAIEPDWGVICFPENFEGIKEPDPFQIRVTNAANYDIWKGLDKNEYNLLKQDCISRSLEVVGKIVGNYPEDIVYTDSFTPVTIEKFTSKAYGAVYGSPVKMQDGRTPFENLFLAGTDQGYLGIVGAMLSGVTIVNQHLLA